MSFSRFRRWTTPTQRPPARTAHGPDANEELPPQTDSTQLSLVRLTPALLLSIVLWALLFGMVHLTWRLVG